MESPTYSALSCEKEAALAGASGREQAVTLKKQISMFGES